MEGLVSAACEPGLIERAAFPARTVLGYEHTLSFWRVLDEFSAAKTRPITFRLLLTLRLH